MAEKHLKKTANGGSFTVSKKDTKQLHHNCIYSFLSEVVFSVYTSRSKRFLDVFFNIFTQFGINRMALQVRSDTIFPLSFVRQTPGVSFVFTPGAVLGSVFTNHRNFGDCDVWFSKISPFYFRFLEHGEQLITIPHQLLLKLPEVSKENTEKIHKLPTNSSLWWSCSLSEGIFSFVFAHICIKSWKSDKLEKTSHSCLVVPC